MSNNSSTATPNRPTAAFASALRNEYPGYDTWTGPELRNLDIQSIKTLALGLARSDTAVWTPYIPQGFKTQYGDRAPIEFLRALSSVAQEKGHPAMFSEVLLDGGLRGMLNLPSSARINYTPNVRGAIDALDSPVTLDGVTPAEVISYEANAVLSQMAKAREHITRNSPPYESKPSVQIQHTPAIAVAVGEANPTLGIKPNLSFGYKIEDREAFMFGIESYNGASAAITPPVSYNPTPQQMCESALYSQLMFNNPLDASVAWSMGKALSEFMSLTPEQQAEVQKACPDVQLQPVSGPPPKDKDTERSR